MSKIRIDSEYLNESFDFEKVAQQACGSVWYRNGGTVILASVAVDEHKSVDEDFLPLTVQYIEKSYANAKFPSGFIKREGKPSDFETLTSRIIDRTLRPLFPQGYSHPTQISIIVLSYDGESDLQVCALNAVSSALFISSIPINYPVNAIRIGKDGNSLIINPTSKQLQESSLDLYVSGCNEDILMIEMKAMGGEVNEMSEEEFYEAIELAKKVINSRSKLINESFKSSIRPAIKIKEKSFDYQNTIIELVQNRYLNELRETIVQMAKSERASELEKLASKIAEDLKNEWSLEQVTQGLQMCKKRLLREMILTQAKRADGRRLDEVRQISIETNLLPHAHGSCLFTRGQTQALVVATIGGDNDAQSYELLGDRSASKEKFMMHYNFPSFCVGEASMITAPGRRELGHGNLAKRALESNLKDKRTIRLVSEILESNGSSSMASVCGGSLALKACGVESGELVAGVAMGLIKEGGKYAVLTDIMGLEDFCGDMDFKVAGTKSGITALQMDIKLGGIDSQILKDAIEQAKVARLHILGIMDEACRKIKINDSIVPSTLTFNVAPDRIVEVIGQGGKIIKEIIEQFGVSIDLDRTSGEVRVNGTGKERLEQVKAHILDLLQRGKVVSYEVGMKFEGKVKKVVDFGAFVEMPNGGDGLLHISKIRARGVEVSGGEVIVCRILSVMQNKIELDFA